MIDKERRCKTIYKKYFLQISYILLLTLCFPINVLCMWYGIEFYIKNNLNEKGIENIFIFYGIFMTIYVFCIFILAIINIIQSFQKYRQKEMNDCINSMLILKYGLLCFFVVHFVVSVCVISVGSLLVLAASRGTILFTFPVVLPWFIGFIFILIFFTWLMLLPGAFYAVQVIRMSILEKKCSPRMAIIHILLQFIFLVDVLDTMYISVKMHNKGKKTL